MYVSVLFCLFLQSGLCDLCRYPFTTSDALLSLCLLLKVWGCFPSCIDELRLIDYDLKMCQVLFELDYQ